MRRLPESVHLDGVHPARTERIRPRAKEMNGLNDWLAKRKRRGRFWSRLGVFDSWLDSSIAGGWEAVQDRYNAASSFFARFRLSGWKRIANEAASEALTLGCGGLLLLYMLALPAFQEIDETKAFGTGIGLSLGWLDIEVRRKASGEPFVLLHGEGAKTAVRLGITELRLTLSHSDHYAVAHALAIGE